MSSHVEHLFWGSNICWSIGETSIILSNISDKVAFIGFRMFPMNVVKLCFSEACLGSDMGCVLLPEGTSVPVGHTHSLSTSDTGDTSFHLQDKHKNGRMGRT